MNLQVRFRVSRGSAVVLPMTRGSVRPGAKANRFLHLVFSCGGGGGGDSRKNPETADPKNHKAPKSPKSLTNS